MTPHDLKNSVWQLAVQGKLVEQRSEEGTGEELFQQIQVEKQALIKAGKIKKSKLLPAISDDEKPFDLPDGWCWARLEDLCSLITDGTHKTPSYTSSGIRFLSVKDISSGYFDLSNTKFISESEHAVLTQRCKPEWGDVLICRIGTLGKALAVNIDIEFSIFVSLGLIKPIKKELAKYIETVINSGYGFSWIQKVKVGGGTHTFKINLDDLRLLPIPLPPIDEQKRIVAKLEEILPLIDRYEAAWNKLEEFNKRFPGDMQKSILQLAIQGKLVEQRPEEGTGQELFQQIQAEKQALINAGKIKKEKPQPEIAEDEIPFDIPESWKWVRLGYLTEVITSGSRDWAQYYSEEGDIFLRMGNLSRRSFALRLDKIQRVKLPENAEGKRTSLQAGDLLFSITGEVGTLGLIPDGFGTAYINQHTAMIRFLECERNRYIPYLFLSDYAQKFYNGNQHGIKNSFRLDTIAMLPVPLPPLDEQRRIVSKLEEILPLCERLK